MKCDLQKITSCTFVLAAVALAFAAHIARAQTELPPEKLNKSVACHIKNDSVRLISSAKIGKAPDNLQFKGGSDACSFYERAEQMFLWLTSPVPSKRSQGSYVFNSPLFYKVWSTGIGTRSFAPITRDETRHDKITLDVKIDIEPRRADAKAEPGQADANVLTTQNSRLVYYLIEVNDVYAYFLTGQKTGGIIPKPTHFPATQSDLDDIKKFAASHKKRLADANTLTVELKSAWIEAAALKKSELKNYITTEAAILTYIPMDSKTWMPNPIGVKKTKLALVGMHVVFSAREHPEMLWATFEHVNNTRNRDYDYVPEGKDGAISTHCTDSTGNWVFSLLPETKCVDTGSVNEAMMYFDGKSGNIKAYGNAIAPSDIRRESPWGSEPTRGGDNTQVISINKQVRHLLRDDVRKNYMLIGTTWAPLKEEPPSDVNVEGTYRLANTTMETFYKNEKSDRNGVSNCFDCHTGKENNSLSMLGYKDEKGHGRGLSHIFGVLTELKCLPGRPCAPPQSARGN